MDSLTQCPLCGATTFKGLLQCIDYTVSHETFALQQCSCGFIFTNPRPSDSTLGGYYESQEYVSHSENASGIINKLYLFARKLTLRWKLSLVRKTAMGKKILDVGCGTGEFLKKCAENGFEVTGVELSEAARTKAEHKLNKRLYASLHEIERGEFDTITLWHVLEHLPNLNETLLLLKKKLLPNGRIFIAVPNHKSFDATYYLNIWAAYDVPRHLWHFSQGTMQQLVSKHGLTIEKTIGMKLDSFYVAMLSEKYRSQGLTVFSLIRALVIAGISNFKAFFTGNYSSVIYVIKK